MESFISTVDVDAPADQVWAILADYTRDPEWRSGVLEMRCEPEPPARVGAITHEVIRVAGRTYRNTGRIDSLDQGTRLEWHTTEGADANGSRTVRPLGGERCRVTLELNIVPHGINRLLAPMLRRTLASGLDRDLAALARLATDRRPIARSNV